MSRVLRSLNKRLILAIILLIPLLAACTSAVKSVPSSNSSSGPRTLWVFAAASLSEAFDEVGAAFQAEHPGITVTFNFAGTQALRTQIEQGARADVFASASPSEMQTLISDGYVEPTAARSFLTNQLVVILPPANPAGLERLQDLGRPGIKLVLAAADVPVGSYARQALDKMNASFGDDFKARVLANVVSNEDNVKQVVAKVQLGEADGGIVYTSDAIAAPALQSLEIPPDLNVISSYSIAPLADSSNTSLAREFVGFLFTPQAQNILKKWGFRPVQ